MVVAAAMAIPPIVGVGARCQRSGRGGTTAPMVGAKRRTTAPSASDAAVAIRKASAISKGKSRHRSHQLRLAGGRSRLAEHERRPAENAVADRVQPDIAWQQLLQPIELEPVDGIAGLRLDERQRNHPVEEEVIRVAPRPRQLRRPETLGERQLVEDREVLVARARIVGDALVPDPRLPRHDDREADAAQLDAHLRPVDDRRVAERHQPVRAEPAFRRHDVDVRRELRNAAVAAHAESAGATAGIR